MKKISILIILFYIMSFNGCEKASLENSSESSSESSLNYQHLQTLTIKQVQSNENLRAYLWIPNDYSYTKKYPAVVMAHGCGGVHYKDEPQYWTSEYIAGKYKFWAELLNKNGFIVLLVDSFTTRDNNDVGKGVCNIEYSLRPSKIDPISIRPVDIASGISYLKNRNDIEKNKIGVLSFSNGATSALVFANHMSLLNRKEELEEKDKKPFFLELKDNYKASTIITLYPGCGLNGYSDSTKYIFNDKFETDTPTYLFMASNDTVLPSDTKEKCYNLRDLDEQKDNDSPIIYVKEVPNTDHQFDYYQQDQEDVNETINQIVDIFKGIRN